MRQRQKIIVLVTILAGMAVFAAYGFIHSANLFPKDNLWDHTHNPSAPTSTAYSSMPDQLTNQYNIPNLENLGETERRLFSQKPGRTVGLHEPAEYREVLYTVNSFYITKQSQLKSNQYTELSWPKVDENRNIIDDYNYFMIDITLENKSDQQQEIYLNSLWLYFIKNNNSLHEGVGEVFGYDGREGLTKDFYCHTFEPGEKKDFKLAYYIKDELAADLLLATLIIQPGDYPQCKFLDMMMK